MLTLYRLAFSAEMKNYLLQCEQQRNETGTSRSHTWMEHRTGAVGREGFEPGSSQQSLIREGYAPMTNPLPFLGRGSYSLTLRRTPLSKHLEPVLTTTTQAETYPVSDDPLSGSAWRSAARPCYRDRAGITNFMCEEKPYPVCRAIFGR